MSLRGTRIRDGIADAAERWRIAWDLARKSAAQAVIALSAVVIVELAATLALPIKSPVAHFLAERVPAGSYADLLAAGVGVVGTLLGLYYATVGVVASTVYQSVPASVRTLFVQEPSGSVYVAGATRATVFGITELLLGACAITPPRLALIVFAGLGLNTLFRLAVLGARIFNFFDPTALASTLRGRIVRAATRAARTPGSLDSGVQAAAHLVASQSLSTYHDLGILLEDRKSRTAAGPQRLTRQLIRTSLSYASLKSQIPSESQWWGREPTHSSWMTLDQMRLEMSLRTGTGVAPTFTPNRLWFEEAVSRVLSTTFAAAFAAGGSPATLTFADEISQLVWVLGSRLQLREAVVLIDTWSISLRRVLSAPADGEAALQVDLNQVAAAEQMFFPIITAWLGLVDGAESVAAIDLTRLFARAFIDRRATYNSRLPGGTVELLETLLRQGESEFRAEGVVVSPDWWRSHLLGRSIRESVLEQLDLFVGLVDSLHEQVRADYLDAQRYEIAAAAILSSLELYNKVGANAGRLDAALSSLEAHRNIGLSDLQWGELPNLQKWAETRNSEALVNLSRCLRGLRTLKHDPRSPDLHGQTYQHVFEGAFEAILAGDRDVAIALFRAIFNEADPMRLRVVADLADRDSRTQLIYAAEPVVGLLELSGYARLLQDLDGTGIWDEVREQWDEALTGEAGGARSTWLLQVVKSLESVHGLTSGGLMRTGRLQQIERVLAERGLVALHRMPGIGEPDSAATGQSVFVRVFVDSTYGLSADLADLFVADYLKPYLPPDTDLGVKIRSLAERLAGDRSFRRDWRRRQDSRARPERRPAAPEQDDNGTQGVDGEQDD